MSAHASDTAQNPSEEQFFKALMADIMKGSMIPKVQIERAIGPIIGFFLGEAISAAMGKNIISLCPEFPIRKARVGATETDNNQSTNIDWLMYNLDTKEIILLELKTTDTTFKPEQASTYQKLQQSISAHSAEFLIDDIVKISTASQESGKYKNVLRILEEKLPNVRELFSQCHTANVIYLAPSATKPKDWDEAYSMWKWLPFNKLPKDIEHPFALHWQAVHESLLTIDGLTNSIRNGQEITASVGKNYRHLYTFEEVLLHCRNQGKSIVIGLMEWRKKLPSMKLEHLHAKIYKCDSASGGIGKKLDRNWISGDEFLSHVSKLGS